MPIALARAAANAAAAEGTVFRQSDTDGGGGANGHLVVDYQFVGC